MRARSRSLALASLLAIAALLFLTLLFKHISYPLLWHDESDTVMFGQRVVEYGYPKVHGPKNVVYGLTHALRVGVDDRTDAYIGAPWGYYYYTAIGVALARNVDDLYVRTALVRLPFAAIGDPGTLVLALPDWVVDPGPSCDVEAGNAVQQLPAGRPRRLQILPPVRGGAGHQL